jgi:hypothetical protein
MALLPGANATGLAASVVETVVRGVGGARGRKGGDVVAAPSWGTLSADVTEEYVPLRPNSYEDVVRSRVSLAPPRPRRRCAWQLSHPRTHISMNA